MFERDKLDGTFTLAEFAEFFDEDNARIFYPAIYAAIGQGVPFDIILKLNLNSEIYKWVRVICQPETESGPEGHYLRGTIQDISEQVRARELIKQQTDLLDYIIQHDLIAVAVFDKELKYVYASDNLKKEYGIENKNIIGTHFYEILPEMPEKWKKYHQRVLNGETLKADDDKFVRQDGSVTYVRWELRPWYLIDGTIGGMILYSENTTQRKLMEIQLQESEKRYRELAESTHAVLWEYDITSDRFLYISPQIEKLLGYKPEDFINAKFWLDHVHEDDYEVVYLKFRESVSSDKGNQIEFRFRKKDGDYVWIRSIASNEVINGKPVKIRGILVDFSDLKFAQISLQESEEHFRKIFENAPMGYQSLDINGYILEVNNAWLEILGYSSEEVIGEYFGDFMADDDREKFRNNFDHFKEIAFVRGAQFDMKHKSGKVVSVEIDGRISRDKQGKFQRSHCVVQNISERKLIEQERAKSAKLESIGMLAGGIAHDFNNILTAMMGNLSLIDIFIDKQGDPKLKELLRDSELAGRRAVELTRQLLTFSRGGDPIRRVVRLQELIRETVEFPLRGSNIRTVYDMDDELWSCEIDAGQISQVIHNLVLNSKQAMPAGGLVRIEACNFEIKDESHLNLHSGRYVRISIEDEGTGIREEHLNKIFDPYFTTKDHGSGLGLATSYSIINKHKGEIVVSSEWEKGTTFDIYLPSTGQYSESVTESSERGEVGKGRILLMDDEEAVLLVGSKMLISLGQEVVTCNSGEDAVELVKESTKDDYPFSAVFLDMTVPGFMGGKETAPLLKQINSDLKLVVCSGYSEDPVMADPGKYSFDDILKKPFSMNDLKKLLERII